MNNNMFKTLSSKEELELIQWARDNFHQKVGVSGSIKAIWHPVVRQEMYRLKQAQMETFKAKNNLKKK